MAIKRLIIFMLTIITILIFSTSTGCEKPEKPTLTVAAGAGLTDALSQINTLFEQQYDITIYSNFAASGDLQMQIENGAPVDIFFAAGTQQLDELEALSLIIPETRRTVLGNRLVLISPKNNPAKINGFQDLLSDSVELIALGDPQFVPAGYYGLLAFEYYGIPYAELRHKIVSGNNVRQVLHYVENGSVDCGIVYFSDTINSKLVEIVSIAPSQVNDEIVFPVATVASTKNPGEAATYISFLFSAEAQDIFSSCGFVVLEE